MHFRFLPNLWKKQELIIEEYKMKISFVFVLFSALLIFGGKVRSQDPDFHIYLCIGQSNMEGAARAEKQDSTVDPRFQVLASVDCPELNRVKGNWYPAVPPLCRCRSGLSPADYFGRIMAANLPENIRVGVINVSIGGCKIELFDKQNYLSYVATAPSWMVPIIRAYDGNPYGRLVEMAKIAQKSGVIKGILLHQGESNTNDSLWPLKVKKVYDNLVEDLNLRPEETPLLAGEVVDAEQGGTCAAMNVTIATLPQTLKNSWVISSKGCTVVRDKLHFTPEGYRKLGTRYAHQMLSLMGINIEQ